MAWGRRQHDETVAQEYRRALRRSADDQAVAEAERTVRELWLTELDRLQNHLKAEYAAARDARARAWAAVHDRRRAGDRPGLARAQRDLGESNANLCRCAQARQILITIAAEERDLMALADERSELVATANRIRVRTAWEGMRAVWAKQPSHPRVRGRGF